MPGLPRIVFLTGAVWISYINARLTLNKCVPNTSLRLSFQEHGVLEVTLRQNAVLLKRKSKRGIISRLDVDDVQNRVPFQPR